MRTSEFKRSVLKDKLLDDMSYIWLALVIAAIVRFFLLAIVWWAITALIGVPFSWNWMLAFFLFVNACSASEDLKINFNKKR